MPLTSTLESDGWNVTELGPNMLTAAQAAAVAALVQSYGNPNSMAVLGDSYFANAATITDGVRWSENAMSPAIAMNTLLGGPWDVITDGSQSGQTSAQWISNSTQLAAVLASTARFVFVGFPANDPDLLADAGSGVAATSIANLTSIYSQIVAAGKVLMVVNGGNKNSWTAIQRGYAQQISDFITAYAQVNGYPCVDLMSAINDPATAIGSTTFLLSDTATYVHPNPAGHLYAAARSLSSFSRFAARPINVANMATQGLYGTGMAGNTGGYPNGWSAYSSGVPTGTSATKVARIDGPGEFVRITGTSDAAGSRLGMNTASISFTAAWPASTAVALGRRVTGTFGDHWVCTTAGTTAGSQPVAMAAASVIGQQSASDNGVIWTRYKNIVPGTSKLSVRVEFDMTSVSGGNSGAQPVLLLNFTGSPAYSGIRAGVISGAPNELCQRWTFTKPRRPILVAPYQVTVPSGAAGMQMYLYQTWDSASVTSSFDIYGVEVRVD